MEHLSTPQRETKNSNGIHDVSGQLVAEAAFATGDDVPLAASVPTGHGPSAVRGAAWTVGGFVFTQVLRLGSNLILTRLVAPYVFGVINLVNLLLQGLHMFSDLGIRQCVINSQRGDEPRFLNTAWTLQVIRGMSLWGITLVVCWPLAWFYETRHMLWLIPLVGLTAVCDGCNSAAVYTVARRLEVGKIVIRDVFANVVSVAVVILWLAAIQTNYDGDLTGHQLLAFAAGNVLSNVILLALSHTLIGGARDRFAWDPQAARELARYGGWIALSTACTFLAANLDRLVIGKIDFEVLAKYHIAAQLARMPTLLLAEIGRQLVFPLYSKLLRDGIRLGESFTLLHSASTGFAAWLVAGAIAACPTLVWLVYADAYRDAGEFVRWLSIAAWLTILQTSSEVVLLAEGHTRQIAAGQFTKLVLLGPLLLGGYYLGGIIGVIAGYTIAEAGRYAVLSAALARSGLPVMRLDLLLTGLLAVTAGATILVGPWLEGPGGKMGRYGIRFLAEAGILTAMWLAILAAWWPRRGKALLHLLRSSRSPR